MAEFTHFDETGASRMVDVSDKQITKRTATAESFVTMQPETLAKIRDRGFAKGDVLEVARLAGIMAAKKTAELIPLCHILPLESAQLNFTVVDDRTVRIEAMIIVTGRTGVEMEALTAVSVAGLTVYDMCKSVDREMTIGPTRLLTKSGGKSDFVRSQQGI